MNQFTKQMRSLPNMGGPKGALRTMVVAICAIGGGVLLGSIAPLALNLLFMAMSKSFVGDARGTEPFKISTVITVVSFALLGLIFGGFAGVRALGGLDRLGVAWEKMEI